MIFFNSDEEMYLFLKKFYIVYCFWASLQSIVLAIVNWEQTNSWIAENNNDKKTPIFSANAFFVSGKGLNLKPFQCNSSTKSTKLPHWYLWRKVLKRYVQLKLEFLARRKIFSVASYKNWKIDDKITQMSVYFGTSRYFC